MDRQVDLNRNTGSKPVQHFSIMNSSLTKKDKEILLNPRTSNYKKSAVMAKLQ